MKGYGLLKRSNGDSYEGYFSKCEFHRIGTYRWANG